MSDWLVDQSIIYKLTLNIENIVHTHLCYLKPIDDKIQGYDLFLNKEFSYDVDKAGYWYYQPQGGDITSIINTIKTFLSKCDRPDLFLDYFTHNPVFIFSRNIVLFNFLDYTKYADFQNIINKSDKVLIDLKSKWLVLIEKARIKALEYLDSEKQSISQNINDESIAELEALDEVYMLVKTTDFSTDILSLDDVDNVLTYWPPLLLPAPAFVNNLSPFKVYNDH